MSHVERSRLLDYLDHMTEAVRLATGYVEGLDKAALLNDKRTQQAVIMNILVIGEAAGKIATEYPEFVEANPGIPWKQMHGMRNRMARHQPGYHLGYGSKGAARTGKANQRF